MTSLTNLKTIAVGALSIAVFAAVARAQEPGQSVFKINDADPVSSVPSQDQARQKPLEMGYFVMELSDRALAAEQRNDHKQAAQYYRAMAKAVPDRATGYSKACQAHARAGEWELALEVCRVALATEGVTVADHLRYVQVMLRRQLMWTPLEVEEVDAVLAQLNQNVSKARASQLELRELECQVAVRLEDAARLRACNAALMQLSPKSPQALVYGAALALQQRDFVQVERIIERARHAGVPSEAIEVMQQSLNQRRPITPGIQQLPRNLWLGLAVLALSACIALLVLAYRRRPIHPAR